MIQGVKMNINNHDYQISKSVIQKSGLTSNGITQTQTPTTTKTTMYTVVFLTYTLGYLIPQQ